MKDTTCPICEIELITRSATPCMECGADESELDHYLTHEYSEFKAYFGYHLVLCDFCVADFASYDPSYFGFSKGSAIGCSDWTFVRHLTDIKLRPEPYCPSCAHLVSFLNFVGRCRQSNDKGPAL